MTTIICLGNRFVPGDDAGCRVFDYLAATAPRDLEVIDGGLCGLNLLRMVEGKNRVVFVDTVAGMAEPGAIVVLDREQVAACAGSYGHGAGLPYLMSLLPEVCPLPLPEITLVGVEGIADAPTIRALARRCLEIAHRETS